MSCAPCLDGPIASRIARRAATLGAAAVTRRCGATAHAGLRASGRTLIELMVALALGALILTGVVAVFVGLNQSTRVSTGLAGAEDSGQVALTLLGTAVRRAGYSEVIGKDAVGLAGNLLYDGPRVGGCTRAAPTLSNAPTGSAATPSGLKTFFATLNCQTPSTTAGASDTLAVWFQADSAIGASQGELRDCGGAGGTSLPLVAANESVMDRAASLRLARNVYYVNDGRLVCEGSGNPNNPQTLLDNVEQFKVFYVFDDTLYANPQNGLYRPTGSSMRTASEINALPTGADGSPAWEFVNAVYLCVVVRSGEKGSTAGTSSGGATYVPCPSTVDEVRTGAAAVAIPADGAQRRSYAQILALRTRGAATPARQ